MNDDDVQRIALYNKEAEVLRQMDDVTMLPVQKRMLSFIPVDDECACDVISSATNILESFYSMLGISLPPESYERIVRMHREFFVDTDTMPFTFTTFPNEERMTDLVMVPAITFYSMCEHHMLPFFGEVHIGYLPHERLVGLSKLARLVDWYARRPHLQERLTAQVANFIQDELRPKGTMVVIKAKHLCMSMRGAKNVTAYTVTSALRGVFLAQPEARNEFLRLMEVTQ